MKVMCKYFSGYFLSGTNALKTTQLQSDNLNSVGSLRPFKSLQRHMHINREQDHRGIFYSDVMYYVKVMRCHLMTGRQKKGCNQSAKTKSANLLHLRVRLKQILIVIIFIVTLKSLKPQSAFKILLDVMREFTYLYNHAYAKI